MSNDNKLCLPGPDDRNQENSAGPESAGEPGGPQGGTGSERGNRRKDSRDAAGHSRRPIPSVDELLANLKHLAGLVALGLMPPARANAIRANLVEILRWHGRAPAAGEGPRLADDDVLAMLRERPELLKVIEPLLTAEQIALVTRDAGEHDE